MDENKTTVEEKIEETGSVGTQANENKDEGKAEKTYTQAEYNALDKKLKEKYEKKYEGIDIAKYKEWVESQKTAEEKQAERYRFTMDEVSTNAVLEAGVNKEFVKFVSFEVSQMEGEFDENLAKFLKDNPKYLGQELEERKATGAPVRTISSNQSDGVLSILANKHKDINF